MQQTLSIKNHTRAELIVEALGDTMAELRLIDAGDLIGYIKAEQWANISDLVQSSAELSLQEGVLTFACAADFELTWGDPPSLSLELEFQHSGITAFFTLILGPRDSRIIVKTVWFATAPGNEDHGTRCLGDALNAARRHMASNSETH